MIARDSIDEHIRRRHLELGREVLAQKRVYLDTRYWILFRDVLLGRNRETELAALLNHLTEAVGRGRLICPIEASAFIELNRQSDYGTRLETARLMDRLAHGICIQFSEDRRRMELLYFLRKFQFSDDDLYHPREIVWTKIGSIFGEMIPRLPVIDPNKESTLQASFYDHIWTYSVEDAVKTAGPNVQFPHTDDVTWSAQLTVGGQAHAGELKSLRHAYLIELRGALDAYEDDLAGVLQYLFEAETGTSVRNVAVEADSLRDFKLLIVEADRKDRLGHDLAAIRIPARLHAAMRWNRTRKYRPTDRMDIAHASAALPYCDAFLTDRPLATLIRGEGLDHEFRATVAATFGEALATVHAVLGE